MGHAKAANPQDKLANFGFLADRYPVMAKKARAIAAKGSKANAAELAQLRTLSGWNTRYARKAGVTIPKPCRKVCAPCIRKQASVDAVVEKFKTARKLQHKASAGMEIDPAFVADFDSFDVVHLRLTGEKNAKSPDYSPGAPVCGQSHYLVLKQKKHRHESAQVVLFHPWTLTRFTVPMLTFQRALLPESYITPKQALEAIKARVAVLSSLNPPREIPAYVGSVQSALAGGAQ